MEDMDLKTNFSKIIAGGIIAATLSVSAPQFAFASQNNNEVVEVAFVLDTTGSMADLIEGAKRKIWSIANTVIDIHPNADVRMALIAYRDYGDNYVVRTYDMSSDIQGLYGHLLKFRAAGGGDTPEAVNEALAASVGDLEWSNQQAAHRMVFLVGDAPPHMDYPDGPKYPEVIDEARALGIVVHAVQAGNSRQTRNIWSDIAFRGGGDYIPIPQDGGQITDYQTPYDDEILQLQRMLDKTVVPYGNQRIQNEVRKKLRSRKAMAPSVSVDNSKFYSKRKSRREVVTGAGDIVAAIRNNDVSMEEIDEQELPTDMRSLSKQERKVMIDGKIAERRKLEAKMAELVKKHDAFTKEARERSAGKKQDSFDEAVSKAIAKTK